MGCAVFCMKKEDSVANPSQQWLLIFPQGELLPTPRHTLRGGGSISSSVGFTSEKASQNRVTVLDGALIPVVATVGGRGVAVARN
jgi:hypothetical protein